MSTNEVTGMLHHLTKGEPVWLFHDSWWWEGFGLIGNALFGSRFIVQWLYSEKHKRIIIPPIFWYLSFWGSLVSLIYALHVDKLPFIIGCIFLPILYGRNLILMKRGDGKMANSKAGPEASKE